MLALTAVAHGCGGETEAKPPSSEAVDCSLCTLEQVCWDGRHYDGDAVGGCLELQSECLDDRTCECINAAGGDICRHVGGTTNSNACRVVDGEPVVNCVMDLG